MNNNTGVDNTTAKLKPYLVKVRSMLILVAANEGLNFSDIARIFRIDKSVITRTISDNMEDFKKLAINTISDTNSENN